MSNKIKTVDFYGDIRKYTRNDEFNYEWNIKLFANSKEEGAELMKKLSVLFAKCDLEMDLLSTEGHFISKLFNCKNNDWPTVATPDSVEAQKMNELKGNNRDETEQKEVFPSKEDEERFQKWILTQKTIVPYYERKDWENWDIDRGNGHE